MHIVKVEDSHKSMLSQVYLRVSKAYTLKRTGRGKLVVDLDDLGLHEISALLVLLKHLAQP